MLINIFKKCKLDLIALGERKRGGKKRSTNKSEREKFWPERKALIFEVLSSPSERFGYTTNTRPHTH